MSKYHKTDIKSGVYPSEKHEIFTALLNIPLVLKHKNKMVSSSKGVKVMVCGLDHSGSQP